MKKSFSILIMLITFLSTSNAQSAVGSAKQANSRHVEHHPHGGKKNHHKALRLFHRHKHHNDNHHGDKNHGHHRKNKTEKESNTKK